MLLGAMGALVGLAAEAVGPVRSNPIQWVPDLAVGWVLIGSGSVAMFRRPSSRIGLLLAATGFAWFAPNFAVVAAPPIAWLAGQAVYLYRGPLIQALMSYPTGRLTLGSDRAIVAFGYAAAIGLPVIDNQVVQAVAQGILGAAVIGGAVYGARQASNPVRRARRWALPAAMATGLALLGASVARSAATGPALGPLVLLGFEVVLCGVSIALAFGILREPWGQAPLTDLVVELGDSPTGSMRETLARALGDPTLQVGFVIPGADGFVDARGQSLPVPAAGSGRTVTPIESEGRAVGVLVHDAAVLDDPALVRSIAAAARLVASNAALQTEVRGQIAEVEASRRRLREAEDEERRRIGWRLSEGAEGRLRRVAEDLVEVRGIIAATGDDETLGRTERASVQLGRSLDDLHDLARGLAPMSLEAGGLRGAVMDLAARAPIAIEVDVSTEDFSSEVASAAYFVTSEAVANVVKHSRASRASIRIGTTDGWLVIEVEDDGVGGADPAAGSGLRGLKDRVEGRSGRLTIATQPGIGTRLTAEIPLGGEA